VENEASIKFSKGKLIGVLSLIWHYF
jgi:hypothetical protein